MPDLPPVEGIYDDSVGVRPEQPQAEREFLNWSANAHKHEQTDPATEEVNKIKSENFQRIEANKIKNRTIEANKIKNKILEKQSEDYCRSFMKNGQVNKFAKQSKDEKCANQREDEEQANYNQDIPDDKKGVVVRRDGKIMKIGAFPYFSIYQDKKPLGLDPYH